MSVLRVRHLPVRKPFASLALPALLSRSTKLARGIAACRRYSKETIASSMSSVSQDEVTHFTKLASSWWDPHGPSRLLHLMNPLRHDFIRSCHDGSKEIEVIADKKIDYLDIGCGGGIFATSAARLPTTNSVTAIDPTPSVIQVAKAKQRTDPSLAEPKLTYLNCAIEDLKSSESDPQHMQLYDVISLFEVIEHISQPSAFLAQALQHLKPGGWLIGSTIARHPIAYVTTKLIAEAPILGVVPQGTHDWNQYINPEELRAWFTQQNMQAQSDGRDMVWGDMKIQGVIYVPALGWKLVNGSEKYGNYFFGVQRLNV